MLVLSRHRDDEIILGHTVSIRVVEIRGDKVRIGIEAPKNVPVHRGEVYRAIHGKCDVAQRVKAANAELQQAAIEQAEAAEPC